MVKLCIPLFSALVLFSCQPKQKQISEAEIESYDAQITQYIGAIFKEYQSCVDSFDKAKLWQLTGTSKLLEINTPMHACIPCLHIMQPIFQSTSWFKI